MLLRKEEDGINHGIRGMFRKFTGNSGERDDEIQRGRRLGGDGIEKS
jgi:hypothetical protein